MLFSKCCHYDPLKANWKAIKSGAYKREPTDVPGRILSYSLKITNRSRTMFFFREILGMKILRHKEFSEDSGSSSSGQNESRWSKTMIGYGPEEKFFALELTYNYPVHHYEKGNSFIGIVIKSSNCLKRAKKQHWPILDGNILESPDGYKFRIINQPEPTKRDPIAGVVLAVSKLKRSLKFWHQILGMHLIRVNSAKSAMQFGYDCKETLIELRKVDYPIQHGDLGGRLSMCLPQNHQEFLEYNLQRHNYKLSVPLVLFEKHLLLLIIKDPDGHELCYYNADGYKKVAIYSPEDEAVLDKMLAVEDAADKKDEPAKRVESKKMLESIRRKQQTGKEKQKPQVSKASGKNGTKPTKVPKPSKPALHTESSQDLAKAWKDYQSQEQQKKETAPHKFDSNGTTQEPKEHIKKENEGKGRKDTSDKALREQQSKNKHKNGRIPPKSISSISIKDSIEYNKEEQKTKGIKGSSDKGLRDEQLKTQHKNKVTPKKSVSSVTIKEPEKYTINEQNGKGRKDETPELAARNNDLESESFFKYDMATSISEGLVMKATEDTGDAPPEGKQNGKEIKKKSEETSVDTGSLIEISPKHSNSIIAAPSTQTIVDNGKMNQDKAVGAVLTSTTLMYDNPVRSTAKRKSYKADFQSNDAFSIFGTDIKLTDNKFTEACVSWSDKGQKVKKNAETKTERKEEKIKLLMAKMTKSITEIKRCKQRETSVVTQTEIFTRPQRPKSSPIELGNFTGSTGIPKTEKPVTLIITHLKPTPPNVPQNSEVMYVKPNEGKKETNAHNDDAIIKETKGGKDIEGFKGNDPPREKHWLSQKTKHEGKQTLIFGAAKAKRAKGPAKSNKRSTKSKYPCRPDDNDSEKFIRLTEINTSEKIVKEEPTTSKIQNSPTNTDEVQPPTYNSNFDGLNFLSNSDNFDAEVKFESKLNELHRKIEEMQFSVNEDTNCDLESRSMMCSTLSAAESSRSDQPKSGGMPRIIVKPKKNISTPMENGNSSTRSKSANIQPKSKRTYGKKIGSKLMTWIEQTGLKDVSNESQTKKSKEKISRTSEETKQQYVRPN